MRLPDPPVADDEVFALTAANRRRLAALLRELDDRQWQAPTLCAGWTVHDLAAHLVQPMLVGFGRFVLTALRHRGDTDATVADLTRRLARKPRSELITLLEQHAGDRIDPPRVGPLGPFADTCIHLRDIARPLRLDADVPREHWTVLLDYLTSPAVAPALVPPGRLDGLSLIASDCDWAFRARGAADVGAGEELRGPVEALAMAATGRTVALDDLEGNGVAILRGRAG